MAQGKKTSGKAPLVIAGTASGTGKTTVATGLMGALRRRGLRVAPFKVGPDFIDPGFHHAACGVESRNLDTWLTPAETARRIYMAAASAADVAVVEGVMGLFDGRAGAPAGDDAGSTAEMARLLGGAVVLVVDCARMARSLAPLLSGFRDFDPRLRLAGTVLNNVGSDSHARMLESAAAEAGVPVLGILPRRDDVGLPSRHLGLVPAAEAAEAGARVERIIDHVQENMDLDALIALTADEPQTAAGTGEGHGSSKRSPRRQDPGARRARIAVARDLAFSFYYPDSLEALAAAGAELINFSPITDRQLPDCDGVYLGGGFPELFAAELEANADMRGSMADAAARGLPIYAECGGMVYLCRSIDVGGRSRQMAGVIPASARMNDSRQALGYVEARALKGNILMEGGARIRGHEFHWSTVDWPREGTAYECIPTRRSQASVQGFADRNLLASFVHVNFSGYPDAAERFVAACAGRMEVGSAAESR